MSKRRDEVAVAEVVAMIAPATVMEIRRLLEDGNLSQRKIARKLGISRGTVYAIASGKRSDRLSALGTGAEFPFPSGIPRRCPTCGGMVQMPCLLCRVRQIRQRHVLSRNDGC